MSGSAPDEKRLSAVSTAASHPAYPLKLSANRRYLVDQSDRPFRIHGDSAQSLVVNLTLAEADLYLSDRRARGFNSVNLNLIEHKFGVRAPANRNGDPPFVHARDFSAPNEHYFEFADAIVDLAQSKGILVSLAPLYLGYNGGDEGWWKELVSSANSQAVCYKFGIYIGRRYKARKNIFWVIGGDYFPPTGSEGEKRLHKFMEGVKAAGDTHLWAGDWKAPSISTDEAAFAPDMDINGVYTSGAEGRLGTTYEEAKVAFEYAPPHPAYLKETGYEDEGWVPGDSASVRRYMYWAILGGCTEGAFFGNRDIWEFSTARWWSGFHFGHGPWQNALNSPGTQDMQRLNRFFDSIPWYELIPATSSGASRIVLKGGGTYGQLDYVAAATTGDLRLFVAYLPQSQSITLDLAAFREPMRAEWFDPTAEKQTAIATGPLQNSGSRTFEVPGKNYAGQSDWVLVLRSESER